MAKQIEGTTWHWVGANDLIPGRDLTTGIANPQRKSLDTFMHQQNASWQISKPAHTSSTGIVVAQSRIAANAGAQIMGQGAPN